MEDKIEDEGYISDEENDDDDISEDKRLNLPKKSKYRMRAHCNPLAEISIA
jgi:hypothetical protein